MMTVTIEIKNQGTLNLLQELESLGFIQMQPPLLKNTAQGNTPSNRWLRGSCRNLPEGSVNDFLARCRADKERELAIEKHQEEKRSRHV